MKTVMASKYVVRGYNDHAINNIPKGWIISSRDQRKPETLVVDSFKYVSDGVVVFYETDGTVKERIIAYAQ